MESIVDQKKASGLARKGFEQFEAKNYKDAEVLYRQAFILADPNHWAIEEYHGEFSLVLRALGKTDEALEQLKLSLSAALKASDQITELNVTIARHFLGEYLIELGEYEQTIQMLKPHIGTGCEKEWLLGIPLVRAYMRSDRTSSVQQVIYEVIKNTPEEERSVVKEKLKNAIDEENS